MTMITDVSSFTQEAQLSQRGRAMLRLLEHFAKSLTVTQGHYKYYQLIDGIGPMSCCWRSIVAWLYLVSFPR